MELLIIVGGQDKPFNLQSLCHHVKKRLMLSHLTESDTQKVQNLT
jgi:hypothetical protein